ncbi:hypothetical protein MIND_00656300 [Mycena indigotica]|uniref:Uncharacterized protein n=1 Tax=Mycena indigotica TaxID=2126181 RepID=A0A8H6SKC7_9AGAR|nr:uncharacterized protein MIND_00656300 [Mycena indigotica]KAF7300934.1 hypothetical protein MIND_00656300 [Mycena indigotica]
MPYPHLQLLLVGILVLMSYACVAQCKHAVNGTPFGRLSDLKRHQSTCLAFETHQQLTTANRTTVPNTLELYQRRQQKKKDNRIATATAASALQSSEGLANSDHETLMPNVDSTPAVEPDPVPAPLNAAGRPIRRKRKTWKLLQQLPETPLSLPTTSLPTEQPTPPSPTPSTYQWVWQGLRTTVNSFGLFRDYPSCPTYNPDEQLANADLSDIPVPLHANTATLPPTEVPFATPVMHPMTVETETSQSASVWSHMAALGQFSNSSRAGLMKLVDFLGSSDFNPDDVKGMNVQKETEMLDTRLAAPVAGIRDGWKTAPINISVPDGNIHRSEAEAPVFSVSGLYYRPLVDVIKAAIINGGARCFHYTPFKQFWLPSQDSQPQRVYDEIYSSDAMVQAYEELHQQPPKQECTLERVILPLMFWSDSTHLASFGTASLWPLYLFFGNQSKWLRAKPRAGVCHHVAYFPKLPDSFSDWFKTQSGGDGPSGELLTHCRRELMHGIWRLLLDEEFVAAWNLANHSQSSPGNYSQYGQMSLSTLVLMMTIAVVGIERVRTWIYEWGYKIKSAAVERFLGPFSEVPTSNAFSDRLARFNFNPFKMLVPDFMHEFELGVFKAFFTHLLRVFQAYGNGCVSTLDYRYRLIPTFGQATIRRFTENTSALKKLAAWNWQAILTCSLPVVEGLLDDPNDNAFVLDILFTLAEFHAFAKLRIHTDDTIKHLRALTKELGRLLRRFQRVFLPSLAQRGIHPKELPSEHNARTSRKAKRAAKAAATQQARGSQQTARSTSSAAPKEKVYSLLTYKLHALGDYVKSILWFGSLDSYTTQTGELEHRRVKRFYARTNKNRAVRQMTLLERRDTFFRNIRARAVKRATALVRPHKPTPRPSPTWHRNSITMSHPPKITVFISLPSWLSDHRGDPAVQDFLPKLQAHLLGRLVHPDHTGDSNEFSREQCEDIILRNDRIYYHQMCRVNYTTYDIRRGQDHLNPTRRSDVMMLSPEGDTSHPFSYAQVLMICHANVLRKSNPTPQHVDFLWVRRYAFDKGYKSGFKRKRLHRVHFIPETDSNAFAFLNPDEVIRASHLVPAFAHGKCTHLLASDSIGRLTREGLAPNEDWTSYYVNFFADRDMVMRYFGGGIGHYRVPLPLDPEPEPEQQPQMDDQELPVDTPIIIPQAVEPPQEPPSGPADQEEVAPDPNEGPGSDLESNQSDSDSSSESSSSAGSDNGDNDKLQHKRARIADVERAGSEDNETGTQARVLPRVRLILPSHPSDSSLGSQQGLPLTITVPPSSRPRPRPRRKIVHQQDEEAEWEAGEPYPEELQYGYAPP